MRARAEIQRDLAILDRMNIHQLEEWWTRPLKWVKYIPHRPTPAQLAFLYLDDKEALYGGAAGGGKSDALLMAALQYVDVPGYAALLVRRTYTDLAQPGGLMQRAKEWLTGTDAHWDGRMWRFPAGAYMAFGHLDNDSDMYSHQSSEYQFIGFDELTQLAEHRYRYLFSRARRTVERDAVPVRVRSGTNPGGVGHEWVYRRFILEGPAYGRAFVPAYLDDNPHLDRDEYDRALRELDPVTHRQLRYGDWQIRQHGPFFNRTLFEIVRELPSPMRMIRMWDLAATKHQTSAYTAGAKVGINDGKLYIVDMVRLRGNPGEVETAIKQTAELDGRNVVIYIEQEPGSGGVNTMDYYQRRVLVGWALRPFIPRHDKLTRAMPLSSAVHAGNVKLFSGRWNTAFLDECDSFPDSFRDQIDAVAAAFNMLTSTPDLRISRL